MSTAIVAGRISHHPGREGYLWGIVWNRGDFDISQYFRRLVLRAWSHHNVATR